MRSKLEVLSLSFALFFSVLAACTYLSRGEKDTLVKITARRLGSYGAEYSPLPFLELGQIAQNACERSEQSFDPPAALEMIIDAITNRLDDPLLAADLKDLIALLDVRIDAALKLVGLTLEARRLIKIAVCSFAEGVSLHPSPG